MIIKTGGRRGFTLLEIIVTVGIIGVLASIGIANFVAARRVAQRNTCIANLKKIQSVINTWALDTGASSSDTFTVEDIVPNYIKSWPKEGAADYPLPANISSLPVCPNVGTTPDHTL